MSEALKNKSHAGGWIIVVAVVLVLYVLSYGPVNVLAMKADDPFFDKAVIIFYEPLNWVCRYTPLEKPMSVYYEWWMNRYIKDFDGS